MIDAIDIAADLTVSVDDETIRIHGERSSLAVDADSWRPLLRARSLSRPIESMRRMLPAGDGEILVTVRGISVVSIRFRGHRRHLRFHPLGIVRSLFAR